MSHHTLLHLECKSDTSTHCPDTTDESLSSNAAAGPMSNSVLMTCCVLANSPDGFTVKTRALLDSASSGSFVSEHLSQSLCLACSHQSARIYGITGLSHSSPLNAVASFCISPTHNPTRKLRVTAIIVLKVNCDLPISPIYSDHDWKVFPWPIQASIPLIRWISCWEWTFLLKSYVHQDWWMAGHQAHPPLWKQSLAGSLETRSIRFT